ncbi:MAG: MaoC family dehydratase [Minisyncoccota bacterium]
MIKADERNLTVTQSPGGIMNTLWGQKWVKEFTVGNEEEIRKFARRIGDINPLHYDAEVAKGLQPVRLDGIIAPGVMVVGFVSSTISENISRVMVTRMEIDFKNPLYAGSLAFVSCSVLRTRGPFADVDITVTNGSEVAAEGSCRLILPR